MRWTGCTLTVTYEEGVSQITTNTDEVVIGSEVIFSTNRRSEKSLHTIRVLIGDTEVMTADEVEDGIAWVADASLAQY